MVILWLGLVFLGWRIWLNSRKADGGIGETTPNLLLGFWLPSTFLSWGLFSMLAARTWLIDRTFRLFEFTGGAAVAIGITWISAGICFHCFVVWRQHPTLSQYADPAAFSAAITGLCALLIGFWMILGVSGHPKGISLSRADHPGELEYIVPAFPLKNKSDRAGR